MTDDWCSGSYRFAQKVLTTAVSSAINTVPRAKRPDVALELTNGLAANYENHIGKSRVTSGRYVRGTVQTIASFCARPVATGSCFAVDSHFTE